MTPGMTPRARGSLIVASTATLLVLVSLLAPPALAAPEGCLKCHQDPKLNAGRADPRPQLVLDPKALAGSVHADLDCTDCHSQLSDADPEAAHAKKVGPPPGCADCHEEADADYKQSVHGQSKARGEQGMAQCGDCHGAHDIVKVTDRKSRVYKMNLPFTCASCHKNPKLAREHKIHDPKAAEHYMESIHGHGLLRDGLIVSASCTDCHGAHKIFAKQDPRSMINHAKVPDTCAKCHVGIKQTYARSVHGKLLAAGDPKGPVCIDCHTSHEIKQPHTGVFKLHSDEKCGACHQDRLKNYRETYHGKAIALGASKVAACYDCHGYHDVLPASDPRSLLSKERILPTCKKCHEKATAGFTGYLAHGDHSDKENYPRLYWMFIFMTGLLLAVFGFFGLHTLLWFARSLALLIRDPKAFKEAKAATRKEKGARMFVRFRPVDRFNHFLVIFSFLLLTITGMPLKFFDRPWAQWMFSWMGGAEVAAVLHRVGAIITFIYFAVHITSMLSVLWRRRATFRCPGSGRFSVRRVIGLVFGPDSPMPNLQDLKDFWAHNLWFFGRGPRPQFDRWTYWEKFDYLAVFWGVFIIGLSGLVMWFPEEFTRYIPGWLINVAHIMHSDEALLAAGFIFTFHFFNVHFRIEKFPMDSVIFSGRITEAEMLHERKRLYDRLEAEGRLQDEEYTGEWGDWKKIWTPIGMGAFLIGVVLIIAIYVAMADRLMR